DDLVFLGCNDAVDGWGARSSRPLPSASRRRVACTRPDAPHGEWSRLHVLFGETPNRATGTVALPSYKNRVEHRSVFLFPPIVHRQPPGVLPSRVPVEKHEIGALAMPRRRDSPFTAQPRGGRSRRIRQMNWRPDVIQVAAANNIGGGENGTPRTIFIVGEIDRCGGLLDSGYLLKTIQVDADPVLWTAEF